MWSSALPVLAMCYDQGIGKTRKERMQRRKKGKRYRKCVFH
jgi:hypothetical protein